MAFLSTQKSTEFIIVSTLVLWLPLVVQPSQPRTSNENSMQERIEQIVKSQSPWETAKLYQQLFNNVRAEDLRFLTLNSHPSVAVRAAWEEIRRTIPERQQDPPYKLDPLLLSRFLGFLDG
jgi:hypothetical protein